jgi:aminopeptidase N
MTGGNLTRDEASGRAALIAVDDYRIDLDLTAGDTTFRSISTIVFTCAAPGSSTFLDLLAPNVRSVVLNGAALDVAAVFDGSRIQLEGLLAENEVTVDADCAYSRTGEGLHRFVDPVDGDVYTYTQFEPADARRLYANFEQPDIKAPFQFNVTAPATWLVRSNAPTPAPEQVVGSDGEEALMWSFEPTKPISTYITAVVAGPYHLVEDTHTVRLPDGTDLVIPLGALCRRSMAQYFDADAIHDVTKKGLDFFHEVFDYPYPFGKYDQAFVPEYNLGAMENPGCVTFAESYVFRSKVTDSAYQGRANTILHEMAHMWFGDLVTMKWWDDLWLKESFADFMGAFALVEATRWKDAWVSFASGRKAWAYRQDQLSTTHPVTADIRDLEAAKLNFDGITYAKGASVLKQLVAYAGRDAFLEGARRYFKANAYGNTTLADLLSVLEENSGRDMTEWSRLWLQTAGVNTLTPEVARAADGTIESFVVRQTATPEFPTLRPHRIAIGGYDQDQASGEVRLTERFEVDVVGETTEVLQLTGEKFDLVILNDEDLTYAKIMFSGSDVDAFTKGTLGRIADPMARTLCWSGVWHMTRDAVLSGRRFIGIVIGNIEGESDISVVQTLLRQVRQTRDYYLDSLHRDGVVEMVGDGLWDSLEKAAAASDHQLAYAYAVAWASYDDAGYRRLAALLDGTETISGLDVDQDLRWAYVEALAAAGLDDDGARAEAEVARDDTSSGRRHKAAALASRPLAEAKAEAWRQAVDTPDQPNELIAAILGGFEQPGQEKLLEPYVETYFDGLAKIWSERSIENANRIVSHGYPSLMVSEGILARTEAWLASEAASAPALRRLVQEGRDDMARALAAQARDRAEFPQS